MMSTKAPSTAIHQGRWFRRLCQTSHPPPISASPAATKRNMERATVPAVQPMKAVAGEGAAEGLCANVPSPSASRSSEVVSAGNDISKTTCKRGH
jgi:hypothetical protein